jgi:hypothetical protein
MLAFPGQNVIKSWDMRFLPRYSTPIYQVMVDNSTIMKYKQSIKLYKLAGILNKIL